jgi:TonB family protein
MTRLTARCFVALVFLLAATSEVAGAPRAASADDTIAAARDLYASAAYEDALAVLSRLRPDGRDESRAIEQIRAFCLLALGRASEAERAIEAVVAAEPSYHPSNADVSPRVRSAFSDVRRRMLPIIIQQKYGLAKAAYDRKEFGVAADGFSKVLEAMADSDVAAAANQPPLADLRTLAVGFRELAVKAAAPPPPPPPPAPSAAPPPPPAPVMPRIYDADDALVIPPVTVKQVLPLYPSRPVPNGQGVLEIVINESGMVEQATMRSSINTLYDRMAVTATRNWRYKPATLAGVAVKYRKTLQISLAPKE